MQMLSERHTCITFFIFLMFISPWQKVTAAGCVGSGNVSDLEMYQNNSSVEKDNIVGIYHNQSVMKWGCARNQLVDFLQFTRIDNYSAYQTKIASLDLRHDSYLRKHNVSGFRQIELNSTTMKITGFSNFKDKKYMISCSSPLSQHSLNSVRRYKIVFKETDVECSDKHLQVPPQISVNNTTITVEEGDRVVIQCSATGIPVSNVTWFNNRQEILGYGKGNASLFFKNITRNEQGTYVCIAKNSAGKKEKESIVNVVFPPQISVNNTKITVEEGDGVVIQCSATGIPVPNVTWFNNRQEVLGYGKGNASLFFKNITRKENGTYVCIAKNSAGKKEKESIVNVVYLDFNCSLEFEENVAYLLVYKKGNPSPSGSSCKKGKTKLALDVSKPYTCSANNTFFYHTCIVSLKHENVTIDCSNISTVRIVNTTLSYYSITSNGVSRMRVPPTSDNEGQFENYNQARKSLEKRVCRKVFGGSSSNTVGLIVGAILGGGGGLLVVAAVVYRCICKKTWRSQQDKYSVAYQQDEVFTG